MAVTHPPLPYDLDALEPHISKRTLEFHHAKHHRGYVDKLSAAIDGTPYADLPLDDIVRKSWAEKNMGVFNNAAQAWNHAFYWNSMAPNGGGTPSGEIAKLIDRDFGGYDAFKKNFAAAAAGQFGSGWAWLVLNKGKLEIQATPNAVTPLAEDGAAPLLTMDVWEHAYYLDFQNRRPDYIAAFLDHLINWEFANANVKAAAEAAAS